MRELHESHIDSGCGGAPTFTGLKQELALWARLRNFPLVGTFELTPLCNLRCPMCYVRLDPLSAAARGCGMNGDRWLEIGRQARDMGLLLVTLTGGEPLLHPDFSRIYRGLCELGLLVSVYTNGTLVDKSTVALWREYPPHSVKVSLYGASDATYERMCGIRRGFTRAWAALERMQKVGIEFYCTTTVVRDNRADIPALYALCRERNYPFFHTIGVTGSARGALSDPLSARLTVAEENWTLERLESERAPGSSSLPFARCAGHRMSFFLTWHGRMQFCGFAERPYASVMTDGAVDVSAAWTKMGEQVEAITTPPECADCPHAAFCKRCPGLLAAESGDPSRVAPTFCRRAAEMHALYDRLSACESDLLPSASYTN